MSIAIFNYGKGGVISGLPEFTYTGAYSLIDDGDGNWRMKFLTSGTLAFTDANHTIDVFIVGGGGGKGRYGYGGGGYTRTESSIIALKDTSYPIVIGAGGGSASDVGSGGGTSSAFGYSRGGGAGAYYDTGGNGGSGGAGRDGYGGTNGGNGTGSTTPGSGQGTTTREFGEAAGALYATGGDPYPPASVANTGDGSIYSGSGYSGIVVIRNHREAA